MARTNRATSTKKTGASAKPDRTVPIVGIVFGLVAAAVVAAIVFGGGGDTSPSDFTPGDPSVSGQRLPPLAGTSDAAIGLAAPIVNGQDFAGNPVAISNDGTAKGIVFLAHWCGVCRTEVPSVQRWINGGGSVDGAEIVSVTTSFNEAAVNFPPDEWLIGEEWTVPLVVDDAASSVFTAFGGSAFPYWVFVAPDGTVTRRIEGGLPTDGLIALLEEAAAS